MHYPGIYKGGDELTGESNYSYLSKVGNFTVVHRDARAPFYVHL